MNETCSFFEEWLEQKKVFGFLESGMRGIQEVEEEPWIKSALGAPGGFKVNLVNLFAGLHLHLLQQKNNFRVPYIRTSGRH